MEITFIVASAILTSVIFYQQRRLRQVEESLFKALKTTCEALNLIKKDSTVEDILEMAKIQK